MVPFCRQPDPGQPISSSCPLRCTVTHTRTHAHSPLSRRADGPHQARAWLGWAGWLAGWLALLPPPPHTPPTLLGPCHTPRAIAKARRACTVQYSSTALHKFRVYYTAPPARNEYAICALHGVVVPVIGRAGVWADESRQPAALSLTHSLHMSPAPRQGPPPSSRGIASVAMPAAAHFVSLLPAFHVNRDRHSSSAWHAIGALRRGGLGAHTHNYRNRRMACGEVSGCLDWALNKDHRRDTWKAVATGPADSTTTRKGGVEGWKGAPPFLHGGKRARQPHERHASWTGTACTLWMVR